MSTQTYRVGILGATGMVGQRLIALLQDHPWFELRALAASPRSAGLSWAEWLTQKGQPRTDHEALNRLVLQDVERDRLAIAANVDLVFSAMNLDKATIQSIEIAYAEAGVAVVSNNSAHRTTPDVPMIIPELNPDHLGLLAQQRAQRGWTSGLLVVKPNCSIQSYLPAIKAWERFGPERLLVTTLQAVSGAGRELATWPEMQGNVIPFIAGEEEKSEQEPMRILGQLTPYGIDPATHLRISASCLRVPVQDGHLASCAVSFREQPTREDLLESLHNYANPLDKMELPSAPSPLFEICTEADRPQPRLDRNRGTGMAISLGRLRPDTVLDWKFFCLSHNTLRGAAGGAVLTGELLASKGYLSARL